MAAPPPLRRVDNLLVMLAGLLVAGGLLSWEYRYLSIGGAILALLVLSVGRMRAYAEPRKKRGVVRAPTRDPYAAIAKIRADRDARFERSPSRLRRRRN
jgi:hypothetical protein